MPRPPNPKSKNPQLILKAHSGEEDKINAFKELCARNGLEVRRVLMEKVDSFLREHNWPPGNSQTIISVFTEQKLVEQKCYCGEKASHQVEAVNGWRGFLCPLHHKRDRDARLLKRSKRL